VRDIVFALDFEISPIRVPKSVQSLRAAARARRRSVAGWLAGLESFRLAIRHRAGANAHYRPEYGLFCLCGTGTGARLHLRFIASLKLSFKFSPQDRDVLRDRPERMNRDAIGGLGLAKRE